MTDRPVVGEPSPPPAAPDEPRWGLGDAIGGFAVALGLAVTLGTVWLALTGTEEITLGFTIAALIGQWIGLVGTVVLASRRKGSGDLETDFGFRIERRDIAPGVLAGVLSQIVVIPLLYLPIQLLGGDLDVSERARELTDLGSGAGLALLAVCIVIGAPIAEELFFRGLVQRSVERRHGPRWAIAVSAVAFGITHFQPVQLAGLIAFGVVLAVLAQRAGRLGPAIVAHMAFNATTVAILVGTRV